MQSLRKLQHFAKKLTICRTKHWFQSEKKLLPLQTLLLHRQRCTSLQDDDDFDNQVEDHMYDAMSNEYLGVIAGGHRVLVIQPYIKWGPDKKRITTPKLQLEESVALVKTLPYWTVVHQMYAPLLTFKRKYILGSGSLDTLKQYLHQHSSITAVFISINGIKHYQTKALREELGVEIFDRYSLIIHIFRAHAKTPEARLQVALAEVPFIRRKVVSLAQNDVGMINLVEHRKKILEAREIKLKKKLLKLKEHRSMIRKKRQNNEIPLVAVVGYTNAGKTSLIKALTGDTKLRPRNQLFATLDTTTHEGFLPCKMKVLFIDTIGFIQDVPEVLIAPFRTTLEDALVADILIHIYDASHPDKKAQIQHVESTINSLFPEDPPPLINVANKCDLVTYDTIPDNDMAVVATRSTGIDLLRHRIQDEMLNSTGRKVMKMRVKAGSPAEAWLYKQMTVLHAEADEKDVQFSMLNVVTTDNQLYSFKRYLRQNKAL